VGSGSREEGSRRATVRASYGGYPWPEPGDELAFQRGIGLNKVSKAQWGGRRTACLFLPRASATEETGAKNVMRSLVAASFPEKTRAYSLQGVVSAPCREEPTGFCKGLEN